MTDRSENEHLGTSQKALEVNLDPTNFGSFAEIGAGQEVARWFLSVGAASGTVAKSTSAYDKVVSDDLYGSGTRYVSRQRLTTMLDFEWRSLIHQVGNERGKTTRLFTYANTIAARNFAGTNDCHGWIGLRFQDRPEAAVSEVLLHVNLRDKANLLQQEAVGISGVNLLHALLVERSAPCDLPTRMLENLAHDRLEIDQIVMQGQAFETCDMFDLHMGLACNEQAEAIILNADGQAIAANEFLYKKAVTLVPLASASNEKLTSKAVAACMRTLRREAADYPGITDVISVPLMVVDQGLPLPTASKGATMITRHRQLYRTTAFARRYTQAPLGFAMPLPSLLRIFDDARYQHLEGLLLEGISRLFASNVRVLAYPCRRDTMLEVLRDRPLSGWEVGGCEPWITADQLSPTLPLRNLYRYLLDSGFLIPIPPE